VINTNLPPILYRFQLWVIIRHIFTSEMVASL